MALPKKFDQSLARRLREQLEKDEYIQMLGERTIFRGIRLAELPLPRLEKISESFRPVPLRRGGKLDLSKKGAVYEIISGYVKIYDRALKAYEMGKRHVKNPPALLAWRVPGELLGDFRFTVPEATLDQIEATDECQLLEMPSELLRELGRAYSEIYKNIAWNLAAKAIKERVRAQILQQPNINCMIAKMFLELLEERKTEELIQDGKKVKVVRGSFHVKDIAAFLGYEYHRTQTGMRSLIEEELLAHYKNHRSGRFICNKDGLSKYLERESGAGR
jgi:CRP-like cAMP-binding protein